MTDFQLVNFFRCLTLSLLISYAAISAAQAATNNRDSNQPIIDKIEIRGLSRTDKQVVLKELLFQRGQRYSSKAFQESMQRLRNLRIFSNVDWQIEHPSKNHIAIVLLLQERWTLIPIAKFTEGGDTRYFVLGLYNVNSFGKYLEYGAQFESWNNQAGGVAWFRNPRLLGKRLLWGGDVWSVKRPRALYHADGSNQGSYVAQRKRINSFIENEINPRLSLGFGIEAVEDQIIDINNADLLNTAVKTRLENYPLSRNLLLSLRARLGKINHRGERRLGRSVSFNSAYSNRQLLSDQQFYSLDLDAQSFWLARKNSNIAARLRLASSNSDHLSQYYFLGGFENVRGYLDGQIRARRFWQSNIEFRQTLTRKAWYYLQTIAFVDAVQAIRPDSELEQGNSDIFSSFGIGLRIGSPKIYRFNLRLDLALATSHPATSRLSMGVQQFF